MRLTIDVRWIPEIRLAVPGSTQLNLRDSIAPPAARMISRVRAWDGVSDRAGVASR